MKLDKLDFRYHYPLERYRSFLENHRKRGLRAGEARGQAESDRRRDRPARQSGQRACLKDSARKSINTRTFDDTCLRVGYTA